MTRGQPEEVSVWTGTADTPGPGDVVQAGAAVTISVGVKPADLSNTVEVRYRISEGPTEAAPAKWLRNDRSRGIQYFQAQLPAFRSGDLVSYLAVCRCAGREALSHVPSANSDVRTRCAIPLLARSDPKPASLAKKVR